MEHYPVTQNIQSLMGESSSRLLHLGVTRHGHLPIQTGQDWEKHAEAEEVEDELDSSICNTSGRG